MPRKSERGFILPAVYMVVTVLFVLSGSLYLKSAQEKRLTDRQANAVAAFYLAESGIDQALINLRASSSAASVPYTPSATTQGGYQVTIDNMGTTLRRLTSIGYVPTNDPASLGYAERRLEAYVSNSRFCFGLFGINEIEMSGSATVDSYDSSAGAYNPASPGSNGDIGTNSGTIGAIDLSGNATVNGDAMIDSGGNPSQVIQTSGNAAINGSLGSLSSPLQLNVPVIPGGTPNSGKLKIHSNDVVTLPGGIYWFTEIDMSGNSKLIFTGDTDLYVSGDVSVLAGSIMTTQTAGGNNLPTNLTINLTKAANVVINGGVIYGAIYAPLAEARISGNASVYGSLVAKEIDMSGTSGDAKLHYDEALIKDGGGTSNDWRVISWREVFNP